MSTQVHTLYISQYFSCDPFDDWWEEERGAEVEQEKDPEDE